MERIVRIIRKNSVVVILTTIILMLTITIGVKAATMYASRDVIYDNSSSGTTASTVQEALDELYEKANNCGSTSSICTSTSGTVSYALGTEYTCDPGDGVERTFYVLKEKTDTVLLIMNQNLGDTVEWNISGYNDEGPVTALVYLESQTSNWTVKATLPTGQQIANAVGNTSWTSGGNSISISSAPWLYSNLSSNGPFGYWTSTPNSSRSDLAWYVGYSGRLYDSFVDNDNGVRPVITVSKSQLS